MVRGDIEGHHLEASSGLLAGTKHHHRQRYVETPGIPSEAASIAFGSSSMPVYVADRCYNNSEHKIGQQELIRWTCFMKAIIFCQVICGSTKAIERLQSPP